MDDLRCQVDKLLARIAALEAGLAQRDARIVELEAQVSELHLELQRRKKGFRPKSNSPQRTPKRPDQRQIGRASCRERV